MTRFWEFFENLNEYVYVSDIDTYELVYMNKKLREMCGTPNTEDYFGRKCYGVLQHCAEPCAMCNNKDLAPNHFCEWWYYNPVWDKNLSIKDSLIEDGGKQYRIEIAIDISPSKWRANVVQNREDLVALANETMRVAIRQSSPEKSIAMFLEYMGKALGGDRTYIFERNEKGNDDNTYEWVATGVDPAISTLQDLPADICANWYSQFRLDNYIEIQDLEDIREADPLQYENLKRQDIHCLFVVPLYDGDTIIGFYGVDNPSGQYMGNVADILLMLANYIVVYIRRRNLIRRLKEEEANRAVIAVQQEMTETLSGAQMGTWQIVLGDGEPKFFADSTTAALVGVSIDTSPEETYAVWDSRVDAGFQEKVSECVEKVLSGLSAEVVYPYDHPKRGTITIRCGGILDKKYKGPGVKLKGYHQDISEYSNNLMQQMENNKILAARAQENLDMINDIIGSGMWYMEFNEQGEMEHVVWSQTFRHMLGFTDTNDFPDTLEAWSDRLHPKDKAYTMAAYWDCVAGRSGYDVKYRLMKKNGEYDWFHTHGRIAQYEDGSPRLFLGIFVNITKDIRAQQALEEAYQAANRANAAKTEFLASMSHDIRTPLNAIIGMTAIAGTHLGDTQKMEHCLTEITASSKHLLGLVNEVLDMNRIESGKVSLNIENFDLPDLIDSFVTMAKPLVNGKGHSFTVNIHDVNHEKVFGDRERIQQCLMNFMGNAVKYTPNGGTITFSVSEKVTNRPNRGCYEFVFEDNGIGMSEEFIEHIFEPFARADDERAIRQQGTGLGMPITKTIVQMMNGDIKVESQLDKGSKFTATIFLELQNEDDERLEEELLDLPVLVADDDLVTCKNACAVLNHLGMKSEWVLSGEEAVRKVVDRHVRKDDFFAVILDWKMPNMDGVAATRAIRKAVGQDVPIIIISAYDWTDIEAEARAAGVNAFISKPIFKSRVAYVFRSLAGKDDQSEPRKSLDDYKETVFAGKRILLVEDNEINAEIAGEILGMTGLKADHVWNGREAVDVMEKAADSDYDLIFMDIQMPVMNGYEATRAIRASGRKYLKQIPIIAMSANAFAEDVRRSKEAGMNEHIAKPLDFDRLLVILGRWLGPGSICQE